MGEWLDLAIYLKNGLKKSYFAEKSELLVQNIWVSVNPKDVESVRISQSPANFFFMGVSKRRDSPYI